MTQKSNSKPIDTIRDGGLKATIWKNSAEKGDYFSIKLTRTWRDEQGSYHDSDSFSGGELLRIARLATMAYDRVAQLRMETAYPVA